MEPKYRTISVYPETFNLIQALSNLTGKPQTRVLYEAMLIYSGVDNAVTVSN